MAYTTTSPTDIDFMYKLPENEMLQAISNSDQQVDNANNQLDMFGKYINDTKSKVLPGDQERVDNLAKGWQGQISDVSDEMNSDPANYRQHLPNIRNISRSIQNNSDLQIMNNRYATYKKWLGDNKDADPSLLQSAQQQYLNKAKWNPATNQYDNGELENISKSIDLNKKSKEWLEGMKPMTKDGTDIESVSDIFNDAKGKEKFITNAQGQYLVTQGNKTEWVDKNRIKENYLNNYNSDLETQRYIQQSNKYLLGIQTIGENDGSININGVTPRYVPKTIGRGDYMINQAMDAAMGKYAYSNTKNVRKIVPNSNQMSDKDWQKENIDKDKAQIKRKEELDDAIQKREDDKHKEISSHLDDLYDATDSPGNNKDGTPILGPKQIAAQKWFDANGINPKEVVNQYHAAQQTNPTVSVNSNGTTSTVNNTTPISPVKTVTTNPTPVVQPQPQAQPVKTTPQSTSQPTPNKLPASQADPVPNTVNYNAFSSKKLTPESITGEIQNTQRNIDQYQKDIKNTQEGTPAYNSYKQRIREQQTLLDRQKELSNSVDNYASTQIDEKLKSKGFDVNRTTTKDMSSSNYRQQMLQLAKSGQQFQHNNESWQYFKSKYNIDINNVNQEAKEDATKYIGTHSNVESKVVPIDETKGKSLLNDALVDKSGFIPKVIDAETGKELDNEKINRSAYTGTDFLRNHGNIPEGSTTSLNPYDKESLYNYYAKKGDNVANHIQVEGITSTPHGPMVIGKIEGMKNRVLITLPETAAYNFARHMTTKPGSDEEKVQNALIDQKKSSLKGDLEDAQSTSYATYVKTGQNSSHVFRTEIGDSVGNDIINKERSAKLDWIYDKNTGKLDHINVHRPLNAEGTQFDDNVLAQYPTIDAFLDAALKPKSSK